MFSKKQIEELTQIIDLTHITFIGENIGVSELTELEKDLLLAHGIDPLQFPELGIADTAFKFGILADALGEQKAKKLNYSQFKKFLEEGKYIPMSKTETYALNHVKNRLTDDIRGLSSRIKKDIVNMNSSKANEYIAHYRDIVDKESAEAVADNKSVKELSSLIQTKLDRWNTDFDRVSEYVLHEAFDMGKAHSILEEHGDNARVYKEVYPGACKHCQGLYLTNGEGSQPRIFKVIDLLSNGTNIGRKVDEWKAIVGATHPYSLTDGRTSVLTEKGWKMIKDIEIGEFVLTHKGRFREVTSKINKYKVDKNYPNKERYELKYDLLGNSKESYTQTLSLTAEHKVLTQRGWVEVRNIKMTDSLIKLQKPCSNKKCDKYLDYFARNNVNCCNKDCEKEVSRANANGLHNVSAEEYDEFKLKISKKVSENWKEGIHINTLKNLKSKKHRESNRERLSSNNVAIEMMKKSSNTYITKPQIKLYKKVKSIYPEAILEHEVLGKSLDITIPSLKIDIEYDGSFWHSGDRIELDKKRDLYLRSKGWNVIRYRDRIPTVEELIKDIERIMNNHWGAYKFVKIPIKSIEKYKVINGSTKLYDIGVEEDESFVARGVVIHNCRCTIFHLPSGFIWDEKTRQFTPTRETRGVERRSRVKISIS